MGQLLTFTKLELCNLYGLNVYRHVKDPADKRRRTLLAACILFAVVVLAGYISASAYLMTRIDVGDMIPVVYSLGASFAMVIFGLCNAKATLYREKDLSFLPCLPVKSFSIVTARLIHFYVENALMGAVILLPTFLVCGIFERMGMAFYGKLLLALIFIPVLPTVLDVWAGIFVTALIVRNRHKVLTETVFMLAVVIGTFFLPMLLGVGGRIGIMGEMKLDPNGKMSQEELAALSVQVKQIFAELETKAPLFRGCEALFGGKQSMGLLLYGLVSVLLLLFTAFLIGKHFFAISAGLYPVAEHREFRMTAGSAHSVLRALLQKEGKRYFSSGIYVTNTIVGPVMAVIFAAALGFFDMESILHTQGNLPVEIHFDACIPFLIGMIFSVMGPACSSVSMEGKNWWIVRSLPLPMGEVLRAKWLFHLSVFAPFYVLTEVILLFTVQASLLERLWLWLVPAVMILFSATFGLLMNLKFPKFEWESDVEVVKQSAAVGLSMLAMFAGLIPAMILMIVPTRFDALISCGFVLLIAGVTAILYCNLQKKCEAFC